MMMCSVIYVMSDGLKSLLGEHDVAGDDALE